MFRFALSIVPAARIAAFATVLWTQASFAQLQPPPGPIQPTNRTSISQATIGAFPYVISQSGSYVLTSNIVGVPGADGIVILADDVTLDLNGFGVTGSPFGGSLNGFVALNPQKGVRIFNGHVSDWTNGINLELVEGATVRDIQVRSCGGMGISLGDHAILEQCVAESCLLDGLRAGNNALFTGSNAALNGRVGVAGAANTLVTNCATRSNGHRGIQVLGNSKVQDCTAESNGFGIYGPGSGIRGGDHVVVSGCTARANAKWGIGLNSRGAVSDCNVSENADSGIIVGYASTVQRCVAINNGLSGDSARSGQSIEGTLDAETVGEPLLGKRGELAESSRDGGRSADRSVFVNDGISTGDGCSVLDCVAQGNADDGIAGYFSTLISRCTARFNQDADFSLDFGEGSILDCVSEYSYGYGVFAGDKSKIRGCTVNRAGADGISAAGECVIEGNQIGEAAFSAINVYGARTHVRDNQCTLSSTGYNIVAPNCIVICNRASGNGINYSLHPNTVQGSVQNYTFGGVLGGFDPWLNLEY